MTRALLLAAAVFSASALQAAAQSPPPECTIGKAIYSPVGSAREANKTYELVHSDRADLRRQSKLSVTIRNTRTPRAFDFTYAFSNGYGRTSLVFAGPYGRKPSADSQEDGPGSQIQFFDAQLRLLEPPYEMTAQAPAYLIMPEMGVAFWYAADADRTFVPPDGLWKIVACK